jgi:hypothetical protein
VTQAAQPQYASPQQQLAPPLQISNVPRPPAAVGGGQREARVQQTADNGNAVGNFFSNLFGQR